MAVTVAEGVADGVKVTKQLAVGTTVATSMHGEPVKPPAPVATVKVTVPVGVVAPDVAVDVTVAVHVEP